LLDAMTELDGWGDFYSLVGSSAGALIGLQFVVLTLIAGMPLTRVDAQAGNAYTTPTVVHFGAVLLLSAAGSAPWNGIAALAALWGVVGLGGVVYVVLVARRLHPQAVYQPVFEDWLFHVLIPFASYAMLAASACAAYSQPRPALFLVGAAALLLLFTGIHNAWDLIAYHVFVKSPKEREAERER
jgi:hypothetical protein